MSIDNAVDKAIEAVKNITIQVQIVLLDKRIRELELIQEGTLVLESILGYRIGD